MPFDSTENERGLDRLLVAQVYDELRRIVRVHLKKNERPNHSLSPTDAVHEVVLRLAKSSASANDEAHLRALASKALRQLLVDHARRRNAQRRGGGRTPITLIDGMAIAPTGEVDLLDLHEALDRLAEQRPRQAEVVELRFFGGLGFREIGEAMQVRADTAKEYWVFARAWLQRELSR
ncbi:MAG: ECF-type sigma factor [Planctomycetota bacterium]